MEVTKMSEQDDIFDLDDFIKKNADKNIKKTWNDHLTYLRERELMADAAEKIVHGFRMFDDAMKNFNKII